MSPRVQADSHQESLRTPRVPKFFSRFNLFLQALTKMIFIFDQSFFITHSSKLIRLFRIFVFKANAIKKFLLKIVFPQYHICFPTSVF